MKLSQYLQTENITKERFAADIGASLGTVYNWIGNNFIPHRMFMEKIVSYTSGKVTEKDFRRKK